ncbi:MAG: molybdopterin-dependent oxidoreductase [Calditrichaeota bacterium]|nr:molybdopterin-dependent oxidoreductase [Calditrichota bacterium]
MKRRDFLKIVGIASSATLLSSCGVEKGTEKLIPFLVPPDEDYIPGVAQYYSSTCTECPANCGVSVKVVDFNPIKLEGLEANPINRGALCLRGQSSIVRLYHPDRIKQPLKRGANGQFQPIGWDEAIQQVVQALKSARGQGKANVYLSGRTTGSLSRLLDNFAKDAEVERVPEYEPFAHANLREAYRLVFGRKEIPFYRIEDADFLLTVGVDLVETFVSPVSYAKQLSRAKDRENFRWLHFEPHASLTGFQADKRFIVKPGSEAYLVGFFLNYILTNGLNKKRIPPEITNALPKIDAGQAAEKTGLDADTLNKLAAQLAEARAPMVISGGVSTHQKNGLETAVLTALLQWALGLTDRLVDFARAENYDHVGSVADVQQLVKRLNADEIGVLFLARTNPVATLPAAIPFAQAMARASFKVALTDFLDETAEQCDLILPLSHSLESWGDAEPRKGLLNLIQPTVEPIFNTLSEGDILLAIADGYQGRPNVFSYQQWLLREWNRTYGEAFVDEFLKKGFYEAPAKAVRLSLNTRALTRFLKDAKLDVRPQGHILYAIPSLRMFDGRSKVLKLTSEIPDPLTTISYGEWITVSDETAERLKLKDKDEVAFQVNGNQLALPVKVQPGLNGDVSTIHWDQLERAFLDVDQRSGEILAVVSGGQMQKTGKKIAIPILSGSMEEAYERGIFPDHNGHGMKHHADVRETLYPPHEHPEYRWAMTIDLEKCIGCSACVAACYVENNVAIVGKEEHLIGREMSWIRIEPFYGKDRDREMNFMVMLCQQCCNAPCETVCPVYATMHNPEGLNAMVYNRCVGTRYCHNNCPYKVRRFNWFDHEWETPLDRMLNPDVFVRHKGIMEKCTFCVQRIRTARDVAKDEKRKIRDGEVIPACSQTCPTDAIVFGNLLDEQARVTKLAHSDRSYRVFEEIGTEPAVYYLRKKEIKDEA